MSSNYSAQKSSVDGLEIVRLSDTAHHTEVLIAPSAGNIAYEMKVNGKNVFWWPFNSPAQFRERRSFAGNPFLAPWANRLDQDAFWANGKKYNLNFALGNYSHDAHQLPIHGLLSYASQWQVVALSADDQAAEVTSRLEFWKYPDWMAQFPFAHTIDMTYRLAAGALEVRTVVANLSTEPLPISIGFHPYFHISDAPRDQWTVHLAAKRHYTLSDVLIPTGETTPIGLPDPTPLASRKFDDVFGELDHNDEFWVKGAQQKIAVRYGPKYRIAVVYAPPGRDFICFEPMSGITDAFNLEHAGIYKALQSVAPGAAWEESYWIKPSGF
jgi:aldose 1-epimerase